MAKSIVTLARVRELLAYDPETGIFTWHLYRGSRAKMGKVAGTHSRGYISIQIDGRGRLYRAHRLAWLLMTGRWPSEELDHVNGIHDDNRFANLREASRQFNSQNERKARHNNKTGFLGVHWSVRRQKFRTSVTVDGKEICIGYFTTAEEAHAAYLIAKRKVHPGCTI